MADQDISRELRATDLDRECVLLRNAITAAGHASMGVIVVRKEGRLVSVTVTSAVARGNVVEYPYGLPSHLELA